MSTRPSTSQRLTPPKDPNTEEYGHIRKETEVACFVSCRTSSVLLSHREKGGNKAAPKVCVCVRTVALITLDTAVRESGRCRTALICRGRAVCFFLFFFLARRPVVAHAQLGPGDGHLVHTGGAHFWGEMDDAAVVLHILKFVLLGRLHVDHGVLVHMLLQDHRLSRRKNRIPC